MPSSSKPFVGAGAALACTSVFVLVRIAVTDPVAWTGQTRVGLSGLMAILLAWAAQAATAPRAAVRAAAASWLLVLAVVGASVIGFVHEAGSFTVLGVDIAHPFGGATSSLAADGYSTSSIGIGNAGRIAQDAHGAASTGGFAPENQDDVIVSTVSVRYSLAAVISILIAPLWGPLGRLARRSVDARRIVRMTAFVAATVPLWFVAITRASRGDGVQAAVSLAALVWLIWALRRSAPSPGPDLGRGPSPGFAAEPS